MAKIKIAVLISGSGSNLQALIDACTRPHFPAEIACVISNQESAYGLTRAQSSGISTHYVSHKGKNREEFEHEINGVLQKNSVQLICLAGFMRILSPYFIDQWQNKILNIHPALLPKFGGAGMYGHYVHKAVLEANESESGATVHIVTSGCDEGPILLQESVPVQAEDTVETLAARVLTIEHKIYPKALEQYARNHQ